MGKVITINNKVEFNHSFNEEISTTTKVKVNGVHEDVETKITRVLNDVVNNYKKYNIVFYKGLKIQGVVFGKTFEGILRKYNISLLVNPNKKFVFSLGRVKGTIPRLALKKLRNGTQIKCTEVGVNLIDAIPIILSNFHHITVDSGWFTKLGTQLKNALLQGEGVNENEEWKKFRDSHGSKLTNVQFKIYDDELSENGYILMSISSRGFIHTNTSISDSKYLEIVEEIVGVLDKNNVLIYDRTFEDTSEDEEELSEEMMEQLDFLETQQYFLEGEEIEVVNT